jgi:hypothetical protein
VGATGVPIKAGEFKSDLDATAVAMLLNSVSISAPLTIFKGLPVAKESLLVKLVLFT